MGIKLEFTISSEDEVGINYKKFVRLVHKQITSRNPGFPNSKINTVLGAAWKDLKAELQERNSKEKSSVAGEGSNSRNDDTQREVLSKISEIPPSNSPAEIEPEVELIDSGNEEIVKEVPVDKKKQAGAKKKRFIGPIRIKLTKPTTSQKSAVVKDFCLVKLMLFLLLIV